MDVDVTCLDRQHAFVGLQHRVDDRGIGLGTAHQEENVGIGLAASGADFLLGSIAILVKAVTCCALIVGLQQAVEYRLVAAIVIIALK